MISAFKTERIRWKARTFLTVMGGMNKIVKMAPQADWLSVQLDCARVPGTANDWATTYKLSIHLKITII